MLAFGGVHDFPREIHKTPGGILNKSYYDGPSGGGGGGGAEGAAVGNGHLMTARNPQLFTKSPS